MILVRPDGTLIIVDGPPGAGKTAAWQYINRLKGSRIHAVGGKLTTRPARKGDDQEELRCVSPAAFCSMVDCCPKGFYEYRWGGYRYAIPTVNLNDALEQAGNAFVMVRSCMTIQRVSADYPRVIPVLLSSTFSDASRRVGEETERLSRWNDFWQDHNEHPALYVSSYENTGELADLHSYLGTLLNKYVRPETD